MVGHRTASDSARRLPSRGIAPDFIDDLILSAQECCSSSRCRRESCSSIFWRWSSLRRPWHDTLQPWLMIMSVRSNSGSWLETTIVNFRDKLVPDLIVLVLKSHHQGLLVLWQSFANFPRIAEHENGAWLIHALRSSLGWIYDQTSSATRLSLVLK